MLNQTGQLENAIYTSLHLSNKCNKCNDYFHTSSFNNGLPDCHPTHILLKSLSIAYGQCVLEISSRFSFTHDDVMKWKRFLRYWPFVRGIHR